MTAANSSSEFDLAQGVHGHGSNTFDAFELDRVRQFALTVLCNQVRTVSAIAEALEMEGRTVRAALSWLDGREVLLGGHNDGYRVCTVADDGDRLTAALGSQVLQMSERLARRRAFARRLPRRQESLFATDESSR